MELLLLLVVSALGLLGAGAICAWRFLPLLFIASNLHGGLGGVQSAVSVPVREGRRRRERPMSPAPAG
jgi:hypothetical protein